MGKKFERLKQHVAREYEAKGYSADRAENIGGAVAARIERLKAPKLDDHDTRGTDGVQP